MILQEHNLQPIKDLNIKCMKFKYLNCQIAINCKVYKKRKQYNLYKVL